MTAVIPGRPTASLHEALAALAPVAWTPQADRELLRALRRGVSTPALIRDFTAMGFASADVLDRFLVLLGGGGYGNPVDRAVALLGGRVTPARVGALPFRLDGRPADVRMVIAEANAALTGLGLAPIRWPLASCSEAIGQKEKVSNSEAVDRKKLVSSSEATGQKEKVSNSEAVDRKKTTPPAIWVRNALRASDLDGCAEMDRQGTVEGPAWFPGPPPPGAEKLVGLYRKAGAR